MGERILADLHSVAIERERRAHDTVLASRVVAIKRYQHSRFQKTYADLLAHPRYANAAAFFLDDLYGPRDFSLRDAQFARVVPGLVRLFPAEIVQTVAYLGELHALTEELDSLMAQGLALAEVDAAAYVQAWQRTGRVADRMRQIRLMRIVGDALERYTRKPLLRRTLHLLHGPAHALGLGALQDFLESGFDTFRAMGGAAEFLETIEQRETALAQRLFAVSVVTSGTPNIGELP